MSVRALTIWLVEDNPGDARLIQEYLKDAPGGSEISLEHFNSLLEASGHMYTRDCDLVLLDLHLAETDGLDTLDHATDVFPSTPIIVLTGLESESLGLNAVRSGAQDYLIKDEINPTLLVRSITYAIERVRLSGHLREARDERHVLDSAIAQLGQGMILADAQKPGLPVCFANAAFLQITGYDESEVMGRNCRFLQGTDTDPASVAKIADALRTQSDLSIEVLNYRKDGSPFWNSLFISPVFSQDGQLTHFVGLQTDVTERRRQAERLWLLEAAIEQANDSVIVSTRLDQRGRPQIVYANQAFGTLTGYKPDELGGREGVLLPGHFTDPTTLNQINRSIQKGESFRGETIGHRKTGEAFDMELSVSPVRGAGGSVTHHVVTQTDVSLRKRYEQQIVHDALHDHLTGRPNRITFAERVTQALSHAKKHDDYDFAVLMLDIDQFKIVNEGLGHNAGDQMIIALSDRIASVIESTDTLARLGGDDFGVIIEDVHSPYDVARVARRIHRAMQEPILLSRQSITPTASIGIVINSSEYTSAEAIIRDADTAMYRAKERGRGQYEIFDPELHLVAVNRLTLEAEIRRAITEGEFRVHYQPIIEIETGRFGAGEALVRWQHPTIGLVGPGYFLDVAIEAQLMEEIGDFVLRTAIATAYRWKELANAAGYRPPSVTVNLDERELMSSTLVERIETLLNTYNLEPWILVVEVTERALAGNGTIPIQTLNQIAELGVRIAIDDFGVGYSTFAILQQLPVSFLKLDRSIVNPASDRKYSDAILRSISSLSDELGIRTVAEGIESESQLDLARNVNISFAQGYYLGHPAPEAEVTAAFQKILESHGNDAGGR